MIFGMGGGELTAIVVIVAIIGATIEEWARAKYGDKGDGD